MTSTESDMKKIPWIDSSERLPKKGEIALIAYDDVFTKSEEYDVVTIEDNSANNSLWATHPLWISIVGSETYASYEIKRWILLKYTTDMQLEDRPYAEQLSDDCISRAYIEPIVEELENICINGDEHILSLLSNIKNAPPVILQQKMGHWIAMSEGFTPYECSECGTVEFKKSKYCPKCGAKMEVEE